MREIKGNNVIVNNGIVMGGLQTLESFSNDKNEKKHAWLPKIIVYKPSELSPLEIKENGIFVENPSGVYVFQFGVEEKSGDSKVVYKFDNGFRIVNRTGARALWVHQKKINLSHGYSKKRGISHSKEDNRITVLSGSKKDLLKMLSLTTRRFPNRINKSMFDYYKTTDGNKQSSLEISKPEIDHFSRTIAEILY